MKRSLGNRTPSSRKPSLPSQKVCASELVKGAALIASRIQPTADEKKSLFKKEAVSTLEDATNRLHDASDDLRAGVDALKTSGKFPRLESLTEALDEQRQMLAMTHDVGRGIMNRYDACRNSVSLFPTLSGVELTR